MILGIDHLTLTVEYFEEAIRFFEKFGYRVEFIEKKLLNDKSKVKFMKEFIKYHKIAYLKSKGRSPAIELISYGRKENRCVFPYPNVIFKGNQLGEAIDEDDGVKFLVEELFDVEGVKKVYLPIIGKQVYYIPGDEDFSSLWGFLLLTNDLVSTLKFWTQALGFRLLKINNKGALIEFPTYIKNWQLRIGIIYGLDKREPIYLDSIGFNCMCFLTTEIKKDFRLLSKYNTVKVGEIFDLRVGGNRLNVGLAKEVNGSFIELIEIKK